MKQALTFRPALLADAADIAALVNAAYRGESSRAGWTTEADILEGLRTSADEIKRLIEAENTIILLCCGQQHLNGEDFLGSICIALALDAVHLGMFVVKPTLQGGGIGKQLLAAAENLAQQTWAVQKFQMHVITIRHELIAFYERRGYWRTGVFIEFPLNPLVWQPKLAGLQLETLEKAMPTILQRKK